MEPESSPRPALVDLVSHFNRQRGWRQKHTASHLAMSISIEAGELMECLQWRRLEEADELIQENPEFRERVESELADIYIYLLSFVDRFNLDLDVITRRKLASNGDRFPLP